MRANFPTFMTFLALDIGNTRLKWALYRAPHPGATLLAQGAEFLENIDKLADGAWRDLEAPTQVLGSVVAGDAVKRRVQEQMDLWDVNPQWVVASDREAGVTNGYDHPSRLGADRWVAIIGAYHRMRAQGPDRPMVWSSMMPFNARRSWHLRKKVAYCGAPTCSNMPTDTIRSNGPCCSR